MSYLPKINVNPEELVGVVILKRYETNGDGTSHEAWGLHFVAEIPGHNTRFPEGRLTSRQSFLVNKANLLQWLSDNPLDKQDRAPDQRFEDWVWAQGVPLEWKNPKFRSWAERRVIHCQIRNPEGTYFVEGSGVEFPMAEGESYPIDPAILNWINDPAVGPVI